MYYVTWKTNLPRRPPLSQNTISPLRACRNKYCLPCADFHYSQILHSSTCKFFIPNFTQIGSKCGTYEKEIIYTPIQLSLLRFSRNSQLLNKTGNLRITYKKARSCNHCCRGKAISITYSQWVLVALGIQHAMCRRYTVIRCLPDSTVFFHIIS